MYRFRGNGIGYSKSHGKFLTSQCLQLYASSVVPLVGEYVLTAKKIPRLTSFVWWLADTSMLLSYAAQLPTEDPGMFFLFYYMHLMLSRWLWWGCCSWYKWSCWRYGGIYTYWYSVLRCEVVSLWCQSRKQRSSGSRIRKDNDYSLPSADDEEFGLDHVENDRL